LRKKIGLLGGTFDPVHLGHLQVADAVMKRLTLEKVLFIPVAVPPHKPDNVITSYAHRVRMIELALRDKAHMVVSTIESSLATPSYTIDTLAAIRESGEDEDYYFILGMDAFLEIATWKAYKEVLRCVNLTVLTRRGYDRSLLPAYLDILGFVRDGEGWRIPGSVYELVFLEEEIADISSSRIRRTIMAGGDVESFLPGRVGRYIEENGLFQ